MKKTIIIIIVLLMVIGNVWQALNPRIETRIKIEEVIKWRTKVKTNIKIVEVTNLDGTKVKTTIDLSTTDTDSDMFKGTDTHTKPLPLRNNGLYLGINIVQGAETQLIYTRKLIGPLEIYAEGSLRFNELLVDPVGTLKSSSVHMGFGYKF